MGMVLAPVFIIMFAMVALLMLDALGLNPASVLTPLLGEQFATFVAVTLVGVIGFFAWWYSPLPAHNGGFGLPPARLQKWGFTSEPRHDDYEDPDPEDYGPIMGAFSVAEREGDDE